VPTRHVRPHGDTATGGSARGVVGTCGGECSPPERICAQGGRGGVSLDRRGGGLPAQIESGHGPTAASTFSVHGSKDLPGPVPLHPCRSRRSSARQALSLCTRHLQGQARRFRVSDHRHPLHVRSPLILRTGMEGGCSCSRRRLDAVSTLVSKPGLAFASRCANVCAKAR